MEVLRFTKKLKSVPIILEGEDGVEEALTLKELMGEGRDEYMGEMAARMRYGSGGKPIGLKSYKGLQAGLLAKCLFVDATGELVPLKVIQAYPSTTLTALFKRAQELSALDDDGQEEAKND